ncbi:MAG: sigma-70 family RNA polymerase sigma factor [Patescibacteria group bacterium]|nr:sigma-70 family RNA polymerase sigma factor [Patescibacteria group bacterium]
MKSIKDDVLVFQDIDDEARQDTNILQIYLRQIRIFSRLTEEYENILLLKVELANRIKESYKDWAQEYADEILKDGKRAKDFIVESRLGLVVSIAKNYTGRGIELLDLIQEGNIGLMKAVDKFDFSKGVKFYTYSVRIICSNIRRGIASQSRTICVPESVTGAINKIVRISKRLTLEHCRKPTNEEIGKELGLSTEKVEELKQIIYDPVSIDNPIGDSGEDFFGEFVESKENTPIEETSCVLMKEYIQKQLFALKHREYRVIEMQFGIGGEQEHTLQKIGDVLGVTKQRAGQMKERTIEKLRVKLKKAI